MKNKFTLYWLTGQREVIEGNSISEAMNNAGYSNGALRALDFYMSGDNRDYAWDIGAKSWEFIGKETIENFNRN